MIQEVVNAYNENWMFIERIYSEEISRFGFVPLDNSSYQSVKYDYYLIDELEIDGLFIGDTISALNIEDIDLISKVEMGWSYFEDGREITLDPVNWRIKGIYTQSESSLLDGKFGVGDNATEAIKYYADKYPIYFDERIFDTKPDNLFNLGKDGIVLSIMYDTSTLNSKSIILEISIFSMYNIEW